jgi:NAD+ synthase (glutamine-hydrolysing)
VRIALLQMNPVVGDLAANTTSLLEGYRQAVSAGAELVVAPELALSGYPPEDLLLKDGFISDVRDSLETIATSVGPVPFLVGAPLAHGELVRLAPPTDARRVSQAAVPTRTTALGNCVAIVRDGQVVDVAVKRLLPNYDVFDEQRYFQPGVGDPTVIVVGTTRIGVVVCEDAWVSDGPVGDLAGVDIVVSSNASPYTRGRQSEREEMARLRVRETGAAFVSVNAVGGQDELVFDGQSFALSDSGVLLARAGAHVEEILIVDTAEGATNSVAAPLDPLAEVYHALVLGTRDYIQKNGFRSVVIALSGGVDSALVAAIAVDALGANSVRGFALPSRYSSDHSRTDAADLASRLGVTLEEIPIEVAHVALSSSLALVLGGEPTGLTDENLQSRIRGVLMMGISNATGAVVLTTGNKSEMAVGYSTLYGDSAGGFAVIKDVPKTLVYQLCAWRNEEAQRHGLDDVIPTSILTKAPSAELRPDQRDDQSLPPYEVLDPILEMYVEHDATAAQITAAGYDAALVARITSLVDNAEYKRRQSPPGVRITTKAFGKDRRMPITNRYRGLENS